MPQNTVAIRREDLSKRGEQRVAITPESATLITSAGHTLHVQPATHPETGEVKRAFADAEYTAAGAQVVEDSSSAKVVFGLKEIEQDKIAQDKVYMCFSHTHKGQVKNKAMLKRFMDPHERKRMALAS